MSNSGKKLYRQVYSDENLTEAWHKVKSNSDAAGVDGVTVAQFQRYLFSNLKALQRDLQKRSYRPQPVKRIHISKPDGSKRPLGILTVRDRIVQRAVLNVIEPLFEADFEATSYAFRPGRSVEMALEEVARLVNQGYSWVVDLDIEDFFESINLERLYSFIAKKVKDRELRRIIRRWLEVETVSIEKNGLFRKERSRGLLQGGVISPLFANIYLDRFDKQARKKGLKVVRYADDILILCRTEREARKGLKIARKLLAKLDLELNPQKTRILHVEQGLRFLGETLLPKKGEAGEHLVWIGDSTDTDQLRRPQRININAGDGGVNDGLEESIPIPIELLDELEPGPELEPEEEEEGKGVKEGKERGDGQPLHHRAGRYPGED